MGKEISLFTDDIIFYTEKPRVDNTKITRTGDYSRVAGYKINTQKSLAYPRNSNR